MISLLEENKLLLKLKKLLSKQSDDSSEELNNLREDLIDLASDYHSQLVTIATAALADGLKVSIKIGGKVDGKISYGVQNAGFSLFTCIDPYTVNFITNTPNQEVWFYTGDISSPSTFNCSATYILLGNYDIDLTSTAYTNCVSELSRLRDLTFSISKSEKMLTLTFTAGSNFVFDKDASNISKNLYIPLFDMLIKQ